jgi:hypothetical protein
MESTQIIAPVPILAGVTLKFRAGHQVDFGAGKARQDNPAFTGKRCNTAHPVTSAGIVRLPEMFFERAMVALMYFSGSQSLLEARPRTRRAQTLFLAGMA